MLYLFVEIDSFSRKDSTKFEKKYCKSFRERYDYMGMTS